MAKAPGIGLALGGGAARGLAHIVVLEALDEMGVRPSFVAGCSIGALLGAAYASGLSGRDIREHALSVLGSPGAAARRIFLPGNTKGPAGGSDRGSVRAVNLSLARPVSLNGLGLVRLVSPEGMASRIEKTGIPLCVVATDFHAGRQVTFEKGDLEAAIAASIAIPGVIEGPRLDGRVLIDGAYTDPVPMAAVRGHGCEVLVAVDVTGMPKKTPSQSGPGLFELLLGGNQIMQREITRLKAETARPDVMLCPAVDRFGAHEFLKIREILAAAEPERDGLKRGLDRVLSGGRARD